jgi:hypothetical protein
MAFAGAAPLATITPEGADYVISFDLGALNALLKETGSSYDSATVVSKLTEQDDGKWRILTESLPKIVFHGPQVSGSVELTNFRSVGLIDPAIAWLMSGEATIDRGIAQIQTPKINESLDFGPVRENLATTVNGDGSVTTLVKEDISDIGLKVVGFAENNAPINVSGRLERALIQVGVDGFKSRKAFELWALIAAHPERADLAAHEGELKDLLKRLAAPGLKVKEAVETHRVVVESSAGAFAAGDFKYELAGVNSGPDSSVSLSLAADGISLPVGLIPQGASGLTPTKFDVAAVFKGLDLAAGANAWIAAAHLAGDGPLISEEDADKIEAAMLSAGPVRVEFAPSHIVAPAVDADFVGVVRYDRGKASAEATVHMRGFDKTMAAVKGLGPEAMGQAIPALALAKGLARTENDGSLTWVLELGDDRSIKINGIPFGKAPN